YADLPNGSVKTFTELEQLFIQRFARAQHHVTIGDLVVEKQKPDESLIDYILRWRNLSMKCEPQLQEQHAIGILLKNIHGPIAFLLKGFTIKTFGKLLGKASILQEEASQFSFPREYNSQDIKRQKPLRIFDSKKPGTVSAIDKGKSSLKVQYEEHPQQQQQYQKPVQKREYKHSFTELMN
ncbi:hypothetical protein EE085_29330, partial [Klebsiella pneumoniae]|nr:hypothetical protein [Klebsiella pneumoniae]